MASKTKSVTGYKEDLVPQYPEIVAFSRSEPARQRYGGQNVSTVSEALQSVSRGQFSSGLNDKTRLYCHVRQLPKHTVPGWRYDGHTLTLLDRGLDPNTFSPEDDPLEELFEETRSPVQLEDFSIPPVTLFDEPLLLFTTEEFFQFLTSDGWPGRLSLRVVGGVLLDNIVRALLHLEKKNSLERHAVYSFLKNRAKNPLYEASKEELAMREKEIEERKKEEENWKAMILEHEERQRLQNQQDELEELPQKFSTIQILERLKEKKPFPPIAPVPEWTYETLHVRLIYYNQIDTKGNFPSKSVKSQVPLSLTNYNMKNIVGLPECEAVSTQDRINTLEKEKEELLAIQKKNILEKQQAQEKVSVGTKSPKAKPTNENPTLKNPEKTPAQQSSKKRVNLKVSASKEPFPENDPDIEWILETPVIGDDEKKDTTPPLQSGKQSPKKGSHKKSLKNFDSKNKISSINLKDSASLLAKSATSISNIMLKTTPLLSQTNVTEMESLVAKNVSIQENIEAKKSSTLENIGDNKISIPGTIEEKTSVESGKTSLPAGSGLHLPESVEDMTDEQRLYLSHNELNVTGVYQPRDQNRISTADRLKLKLRNRQKCITTNNTPQRRLDPIALESSFKCLANAKKKQNLRGTAPRVNNKVQGPNAAVGMDPWSDYLHNEEQCQVGAVLDNPLELTVLKSLTSRQKSILQKSNTEEKGNRKNRADKNQSKSDNTSSNHTKTVSFNGIDQENSKSSFDPKDGARGWIAIDKQLRIWRDHLDQGVVMESENKKQLPMKLKNVWLDERNEKTFPVGFEARNSDRHHRVADKDRKETLDPVSSTMQTKSTQNKRSNTILEKPTLNRQNKRNEFSKQKNKSNINENQSQNRIKLNVNTNSNSTTEIKSEARHTSTFEFPTNKTASIHVDEPDVLEIDKESERQNNELIEQRTLLSDLKKYAINCDCAECNTVNSNLTYTNVEAASMPLNYPPVLGRMRRNYKFLKTGDTEGKTKLPQVHVSEISGKRGGAQYHEVSCVADWILEAMKYLVVRKEITSSSEGKTFTTVTFSRPYVHKQMVKNA